MNLRQLFLVLASAGVAFSGLAFSQGPAKVKSRTFGFTYAGAVKDLKPGQEAAIWLPVAQETAEQRIKITQLPTGGRVGKEKQYGNKMVFWTAKANDKGEIPFEMAFQVERKEVKTDLNAELTVKPKADEPIKRFLEADKMVPIAGKPLELIKDKKLPGDQFAAAKELYDVVNNHMKYSKEGKGWGRGDSVWACDSKFGNCTDFHSLFISMARGNKIPAKFEMGFPIPPKRGEGTVGGYHCWAWFRPTGKGWVPVDISEANKDPKMRDYYFGNLTADRVGFTVGRDLDLVPKQDGEKLNFFIYPYVEVDGIPYDKVQRKFSFKDTDK